MSRRPSDVEKRISVLEAELKGLQTPPVTETRFQEMAKLIRVYEAKLADVMNEKTKLERYSESLESQICELVNMSEEVRDVRFILRNQRSLEETKEKLELQMQDCRNKQSREQSELEELRQRYQRDYYKELEALRAQFKIESNNLRLKWEVRLREMSQNEQQLRSQLERAQTASTERLREVLAMILKPVLTISLCKSKEAS